VLCQEWSKRWFVLTTNELACYRDSKDELTNDVETTVHIVPGTVVTDHDVGHGYAFRVSVRLFFSIITDLAFDLWVVLFGDELMLSCHSAFVNNALSRCFDYF